MRGVNARPAPGLSPAEKPRNFHAEESLADQYSAETAAPLLHATMGLLSAIEDAAGLDEVLGSDPEAVRAVDEFIGQFG